MSKCICTFKWQLIAPCQVNYYLYPSTQDFDMSITGSGNLFFRTLGYRALKYLCPNTMRDSLELFKFDSAKASQELLEIQKRELLVETDILKNFHGFSKASSNSLKFIRNDIRSLSESMRLFGHKAYHELKDINNNMTEGFGAMDSSLQTINESILKSNQAIIDTLESTHRNLRYVFENKARLASNELRIEAEQCLEASFNSTDFVDSFLIKAIDLYEEALTDSIGETDPVTWLELGYAYSCAQEPELALKAFKKADQWSEKGSVNYKLKNQAKYNIAFILIQLKDYIAAQECLKDVKKEKYDSATIVLKGVNNILLEREKEGFLQVKDALESSPILIKDLYLFAGEGILTDQICDQLVSTMIREKWFELSSVHRSVKEILDSTKYIWTNFGTEKFNMIQVDFESLVSDLVAKHRVNDLGFIYLHGKDRLMKDLRNRLILELVNITKLKIEQKNAEIDHLKKKLENARDKNRNSLRLLRSDSFEVTNNFGCSLFVICVFVLILLMNVLSIEGWWLRLLVSGLIAAFACRVVYFIAETSHYGEIKFYIENEEISFANERSTIEEKLKRNEKELNKFKSYQSRISIN